MHATPDFTHIETCYRTMLTDLDLEPLTAEVDDAEIRRVYTRGCDAFQHGHYADALTDFTYVLLFRPWNSHFHLALGATLHQGGQYEAALKAHTSAFMLNACDPDVCVSLAQSLIALERHADARDALQAAIDLSATNASYAPIARRAKIMFEQL